MRYKNFMKKFLLIVVFGFAVWILPAVVLAQEFFGPNEFGYIQQMVSEPCFGQSGIGYLLCKVQTIINAIIPVLIALGVVYFVWGVVQYVIGDSEER